MAGPVPLWIGIAVPVHCMAGPVPLWIGIAVLVNLKYSIPSGLQLTDVLLPWKHSTHDDLATQIDVFEESTVEDNTHLDMPGGINLNSHEDIFNALFAKVSIWGCREGRKGWGRWVGLEQTFSKHH